MPGFAKRCCPNMLGMQDDNDLKIAKSSFHRIASNIEITRSSKLAKLDHGIPNIKSTNVTHFSLEANISCNYNYICL